jgi:predicted dehydrogenase
MMKVLIAGLGSIGRRHLRNLRALGVDDFVLLRRGGAESGAPGGEELNGWPVETDLAAALAHRPAVAVIANPTALHLETALACARAGCHLFIEKPLSHSLAECAALQAEVKQRRLIAMVGFQFRFHPGLWLVKRMLAEDAIGPVVSAQAHWGEYLPAWHPWENHQQSYSARHDLGGGVVLTLCHPLDYLRWLLGEVQTVSAMLANRGGLGIEVEDTAEIQLTFASGTLGQVHLDYVQRPAEHWFQLIGQRGTLQWNNHSGAVRHYSVQTDRWEEFPAPPAFERNTMFLAELQHYLHCVTERVEPLCDLQSGLAATRLALAAKESAQTKRTIQL